MKTVEIKHNDLHWLHNHLATQQQVDEVSNYLKDNNIVIEFTSFRAINNGMLVESVKIEGKEFGGAYNSFRKDLIDHVRHHKKYVDISESKEYKKYLESRQKFEHVFKYINQK